MLEKNSLLYWYPKIKDLHIPQPETSIFEIPAEVLRNIRQDELSDKFIADLAKSNPFGYPVFLRTDQASNKHFWDIASFVSSKETLKRSVFEVISHNLMADIMGLPFIAMVFREYIPMASKYKAFHGMPVSPERRYFVRDGQVVCHHPYWVEEAIRSYGTDKLPSNWRELSAQMNNETLDEINLLTTYSLQVAKLFKGYWSVDFCKAADGRWILIDMAEGIKSWHPTNCPKYVQPKPEDLV